MLGCQLPRRIISISAELSIVEEKCDLVGRLSSSKSGTTSNGARFAKSASTN